MKDFGFLMSEQCKNEGRSGNIMWWNVAGLTGLSEVRYFLTLKQHCVAYQSLRGA